MKTLRIHFNSNSAKIFCCALLVLILLGCQLSHEPARNIVLNPLFTDNMVLQQKQDIRIWGSAEPGGEVIVELANQQESAIVDTSGKWSMNIDSIIAGGPYEMIISGEDTNRINNVMVGEVWICSGQSNMEMPVFDGWGEIKNYEEEIANANYSNIRLLNVEKTMADIPQNNFESDGWKECSSGSVADFSAVAYLFGRKLHKELNVPIGLIESAWGGTVIEAWTSGASLKQIPEFTDFIADLELNSGVDEEKANAIKKKLNEWPDKVERILLDTDEFNNGFQNEEYKTNKWKTMELPKIWEDTGLKVDGVVWFAKNVIVPKSWDKKDLILSLGKINDYDITWFNGKQVGRGIEATDLRQYKIPSSIVKIGENKIMVQVLDIGNVGGLYGPEKEMQLINNDKSISLAGNWNYHVDPFKPKIPEKPKINSGSNRPTVLYNGMIHPLLPYGIQGAIWYQGEANAERAYQYRTLFKTMISDWRNVWGEGEFPFMFVQLANFMNVKLQPVEDSWAELREAQTMALDLPNTGMAVAIDIGESEDIHPKNKQEVGRRLALNALAKVYGKEIPYSGPMYKSMKIEGAKIRLKFTNTDKGLMIKDDRNLKGFIITDNDLIVKNDKKVKGFAIAGNNKKYVWAKAIIEGDEIVVSSSKIKNPVAVRYAWAANPVCNLYNGVGLPASPFRTDNWEGITYGKK